jgi:hypothetical protein
MNHGLLTANCYEDSETILNIESTMRKLLMAALQRRNLRLTVRDPEQNSTSVAEGLYRGCTWALTDHGLACVLRLSQHEDEDSAIDVSRIEAVEVE